MSASYFPSALPAGVRLTVISSATATTISATGELDCLVAIPLQRCLTRVVKTSRQAVIVNLSAASFCSAQVVRLILLAHHSATACGLRWAIVATAPAIRLPIERLTHDLLSPLHLTIAAAEREVGE